MRIILQKDFKKQRDSKCKVGTEWEEKTVPAWGLPASSETPSLLPLTTFHLELRVCFSHSGLVSSFGTRTSDSGPCLQGLVLTGSLWLGDPEPSVVD